MKAFGNSPAQIPTNADLGNLAYHDASAVNIGGGVAYANNNTANTYYNDTDISIVNPTLSLDFVNNNRLDPRVTFSRASTATYYDGSSVIAEQNLLLYSQDFSNVIWSNLNSTAIANTSISPDGTLSAYSLYEIALTSNHNIRENSAILSGITATISVYVKNNGRNYIYLLEPYSNTGKYFDISSGGGGSVLGNAGAAPTSTSIAYIGNDWYRCSMTFTTTTNIGVTVGMSDTGSQLAYLGDSSKGVYIWGAQLEQRSAASAYNPTTSSTITNYIPQLKTAANHTPRFDYDPITGECKGLLIEPQATNLLLQSQYATGWVTGNASLINNTIIAPDGTLTGSKFVPNNAAPLGSTTYLAKSNTLSAGSYSLTTHIKAGEISQVTLQDGSGNVSTFDLILGTVVSNGSGGIGSIKYVGNGWYRCTVSIASAPANPNFFMYSSIGVNNGYNGWYIWGAQLEVGTFATSYIPTVASQVTRAAEPFSVANTGWHNPSEFTLCCELNATPPATSINTNFAWVGLYQSLNPNAYVWTLYNNFNFLTNGNTSPGLGYQQGLNKIAIAVDQYGRYAVKNNGAVGSNLTPLLSAASNIPVLYLLCMASAATGYIRSIKYYPKRLSNAELIELTS